MRLQFYETMDRQKRRIISELAQVKGLMPLLMKPRNKQHWTTQDKRELLLHLNRLSRISVYVAVMVMPGGFILMPVMTWWLDRRRGQRVVPQAQ